MARLIEEQEVGPFDVEAYRRHGSLLLREMGEDRRQQPFHGTRLRREPRHTRDVQMCGFRTEEKIGVQVDGRLHGAGAIQSDRDRGPRRRIEIAVHSQRDRDVFIRRECDGTHRHGLQRLFRDLAEHVRRVESDLRALRWRHGCAVRRAIMTEDVVDRRQQVRVAEPFHDHAVHARQQPVHGGRRVDAYDRADAAGRVHRRPEMELVRRVGLLLRGDDAPQQPLLAHWIARRNSSQSLIPYTILSQRPSGSASGSASASTQRETSSARAATVPALFPESAHSTRTSPQRGSRAPASRNRRYQLMTAVRVRGLTRVTLERSPARSENSVSRPSPWTYSCWCVFTTPTTSGERATSALSLIPPSTKSSPSPARTQSSASSRSSALRCRWTAVSAASWSANGWIDSMSRFALVSNTSTPLSTSADRARSGSRPRGA